MNINELEIQQLGLLRYVDANEDNIEDLAPLMKMGVVGGLEIRKVSSVKTCSEYMVEGIVGTIVIDAELGKYFLVGVLDETL